MMATGTAAGYRQLYRQPDRQMQAITGFIGRIGAAWREVFSYENPLPATIFHYRPNNGTALKSLGTKSHAGSIPAPSIERRLPVSVPLDTVNFTGK